MTPQRHYLDHAATTPIRASARTAWLEASEQVGNPSSLHGAGRHARAIVEDARESVAASLGAHPTEVIFTSGATEANNLALASAHGPIVTTAAEHHSVLDPAKALGAVLVGVNANGIVDLAALTLEVPRAGLISIHWVNNETGAVQPVAQVVALAADAGVPVHSDAVQAVGHLDVGFAGSGLALMSVSAHKVGGPIGVGALLARRDISLTPLALGGGQQRGRSGTLDAPGAAAFAVALAEAVAERTGERERLAGLKARLVETLGHEVTSARATTSPHIVHLVIPGASAEAMLAALDLRGIEVSSGSACTAGIVDASHVLIAMGRSVEDAASALRISLGRTTTEADVDALNAALPDVVARARS